MKCILFPLFLILFNILTPVSNAQEVEHPLTQNAVQRLHSLREKEFARNELRSGGESLLLPFFDDFSRYSLPTNNPDIPDSWKRWSDTMVFVNNSFPVSPPTIGVATFDGLNSDGYPYNFNSQFSYGKADTLTSLPIDLSFYNANSALYLMFSYEAGGLGNNPNEADSLVLEFFSPFGAGEWFHKWSVPGTADIAFTQVFIPITEPEFLLDGFKFRFRNYATLSGAFDHWHLDYVWLNEGMDPNNFLFDEVAMQYPNTTLLNGEYTSMPWTHFISAPSSFMTSGITAYENNLGQTENIVTGYSISYQGSVQNFPNQFFDTFGNAQQERQSPLSLNGFVYDDTVNDSCAVFDVCVYFNPTDANLQNDTACFQQVFSNYYAYDDGSAERAYALEAAGGNIAVKVHTEIADTLLGLLIHWIPYGVNVVNESFLLRAWHENSGSPGSQIVEQFEYHSPHFYHDGPNIFSYYEYDDPIFLPEGNFFVGWTQPNITGLNVGNDKNTNTNPVKLFYSLGFNQPWQQSSVTGSVMIHPVFRAGKTIAWNNIEEKHGLNAMIFPNPASDHILLTVENENTNYLVSIHDLSGRLIKSETLQISGMTSLDISSLPPSIYVLTITDRANGAYSRQKLIKE
ncbi:MAG: T9SS type A sorting domain-containing protein [Crocinitomicaceae bacterium]|nr:T9SS type A sorting domain-containing protein [Crocinitomicaceae bacterium]